MHKVRENKTQKTKIRVDQSRYRLAANNRWKIMKNWLYTTKTKSAFIGNRIEILFMTLSRNIFLSNFKYSACAFLPTQHFPLSCISSKTIGKPKICEYLNVTKLGNCTSRYRLSCVSIQSRFHGLYMLTAQNS